MGTTIALCLLPVFFLVFAGCGSKDPVAPPATQVGWSLVKGPPSPAVVEGLWGASANSVYGVARGGDIIHFNGSRWSLMNSGTANWFEDVWGIGDNFVLAVGQNGTIVRYDGTQWTSMTSGTGEYLRGVWVRAADDAWAVGDNGTIITSPDGTTWTQRSSDTANGLYGAAYGKGTFVVVGDFGAILQSGAMSSSSSRK